MQKYIVCLIVALSFVGCASAPPNLSPAGVSAFNNMRVLKGLDLLRDTAISANAQKPPMLSDATTRKVVRYHESALKTIHALSSGWQTAVLTGLDEVGKDLPANESRIVAPYVALVRTILQEVK